MNVIAQSVSKIVQMQFTPRPPMHFDWEDIRYFLETERAGRMASAAKRLGVSHTTVARHIDRLERQVRAPVFERTEDGMVLTELGERILSHARQMEQSALALGDTLGGAAPEKISGVVRVGAPDGFGNAVLSHILPDILRSTPDLQIELVPVPRSHKLWKRDVDIAISLDRPQSGRLILRKLVDYDLRLYAGQGALQAQPQRVEDLRDLPFVGYIDDLLYTGELDFNRLIHPALRTVYKAATVKAQLDAVRAGAGLGVLPCFMAAPAGLVPVLPEAVQFRRSYWLLYPEDFRDLTRIRHVADFIVDAVRARAPQFRYGADTQTPPR